MRVIPLPVITEKLLLQKAGPHVSRVSFPYVEGRVNLLVCYRAHGRFFLRALQAEWGSDGTITNLSVFVLREVEDYVYGSWKQPPVC